MISWSFLKKGLVMKLWYIAIIADLHQICPRISNAIQCVICKKKWTQGQSKPMYVITRELQASMCAPRSPQRVSVITISLLYKNRSSSSLPSFKMEISTLVSKYEGFDICFAFHIIVTGGHHHPAHRREDQRRKPGWYPRVRDNATLGSTFLLACLADTPTLTRTLSTAWIFDKKWKH